MRRLVAGLITILAAVPLIATADTAHAVAPSGIKPIIAGGGDHTCVVTSTRTVICWGRNLWGQSGQPVLTDYASPQLVSGLSDATGIATGGAHTCAILGSGGVDCWGYNNVGQLGNGTTTNNSTPQTVTGVTGAVGVATGDVH